MKPEYNSANIEIPLTFDVSSGVVPLTERRLTIGLLIIIGIVIVGIILGILLGTIQGFIFSAFLVIAATTIFRFAYFNEFYYKKKLGELEANGYKYNSDVIWDIYEIAPGFPICSFKNGLKAVFVSFDKDIVVGKPENNSYIHYEAIAEALQTIAHKGIECVHIDYMDTVGKDGRLDNVVKQLLKTPNEELRQLLSLVFEYQQYTMTKSYTTYDVFAFYYKTSDDDFRDDLQFIIGSFMNANYIRYRLLGPSQLRELVKSIYNIPEFSINDACDNVFKTEGGSKFIRVIYTECDGKKTIFNKTADEIAAEKAQRENSKPKPVKKKPAPVQEVVEEPEIDIFGQTDDDEDYIEETDDAFAYLEEEDIVGDFAADNEEEDGYSQEYDDNEEAYKQPAVAPDEYDFEPDISNTVEDDDIELDFEENEASGKVKPNATDFSKAPEEEELDLFGSSDDEEELDLFGDTEEKPNDDEGIDLFG